MGTRAINASLVSRIYADPQFSGAGYIAGIAPNYIVTVNDVPAAREVEVRHRRTRIVVATAFSKADGSFRFDQLNPNEEFDVIGRDWTGTYNDVIVSRVKPKPY
jgi:hypothetical protein